jgi:hypothetical protein
MGVGVGEVTGSDRAVLGCWNRSTEAVGVAIYPGDGSVWLGQTARCELHCLCFLRKPFVWAGYRPGSDAALQNLKKSRRVSIAGGDRKKGGF